jgi:hypothetical protein
MSVRARVRLTSGASVFTRSPRCGTPRRGSWSALEGGGGTSRVAGIVFTSVAEGLCSMMMRCPVSSIGICTSVITFPSFQLTVIAVVEPNPNGRSCVPSLR